MERLTVTQAALRWGVSRTAILTWIRTGRLTADDVELEETPRGRVWWILRSDPPPHRPGALLPPRHR